MFKKVLFIINPASGVDEPILSYIYKTFHKTPTYWDIKVTKKAEDVTVFAKQGIRQKYDLIAVYGGDGTVSTVAKVLYRKSVPLAIIPGGTANIIAKELQIPTDSLQALELITKKNPVVKKVDMALSRRQPVLLGFNVGLFAHTVKNTPRQTKNQLGQLAYGLTAVSNISNLKSATYTIK